MAHTRDYAPGHLERVLAIAETTLGTPVDPVAGSYIRNRQNFSIVTTPERRELNDKLASSSPMDTADGINKTEWSMSEMYLRPSGALGTGPEPGALLLAGLGTSSAPALSTTVASAPTTTSCTLTSAGSLAVGDVIRFGTSGKCARVVTVATNDITWEPALAAAPGGSEAVTSGVTYKLVADFEKSLTFYRYAHHTLWSYPGCWVNQLGIKFGLQTEVEFTASGAGCGKEGRIVATKIGSGGITNIATSLPFPTGEGRLQDVRDLPFYMLCESEVFALTSVTTDTGTITRAQKSTSGAAHAEDVEVFPWVPSPTFIGAEVEGVTGFLYVTAQDGVQRQLHVQSLELQITNGFDGRWELGSRNAYGIKRRDAKRAIQVNTTGYFTRLEANLILDAAKRGEKIGVAFWAGQSSGGVVACILPRVIFDPIAPELAEGDEGMVTFTGRAYTSAFSTEDALVIGAL